MPKKAPRLVIAMMILGSAVISSSIACSAEDSQILTLNQAIDIAMKNNLQRKLAEGEVAKAESRLAQAKSGYLPKLALNAAYNRLSEVPTTVELADKLVQLNNAVDGLASIIAGATGSPQAAYMASQLNQQAAPDLSLDYYGYSLILEQPLYTGNKLGALNKQAKANEGYARANLDIANHNLVYEVKRSYYTVIVAQQFVRTMQEAVNSMEAHVKEADAYYRAGMVPRLDVMRAEVKLMDLKQKLLTAENGLVLAKMALNFVLGVNMETNYSVVDELNYHPLQSDLQTYQQEALTRRPEVIAVGAMAEMAEQNVELAKSAGKPVVAFRAQSDSIKPYTEMPLQYGIIASMKLYDGGMVKNQVKEAEETLRQARTAQELTNRTIKLEVEQAYRNLQLALETIQVAGKNLDQAKETVHMAEVSYKAGLSTSLERIDAEVGLTQAKTNYIQALSLYNIALAQLEKAVGQ